MQRVSSYLAFLTVLGMSFDMAVICCCTVTCSLAFNWCSRSHVSFVFSEFMNYTQHKPSCVMLKPYETMHYSSINIFQSIQTTCPLSFDCMRKYWFFWHIYGYKCSVLEVIHYKALYKFTFTLLYFTNGIVLLLLNASAFNPLKYFSWLIVGY